MKLETILAIMFFVLGAVGYIVYRYGSENVYLRYKDQRVGLKHTKEVNK